MLLVSMVLTGDEWFFGIAQAVAAGAKCTRRQVGAIIVDSSKHVVAMGKNGSPPGHDECTDGACPRGRHFKTSSYARISLGNEFIQGREIEVCACGYVGWPCPDAVDPGSSYDTGPGICIAVHAEANALLNRTVPSVKGCVMYVTAQPCDGCMKLIAAAGISSVKTPSGEIRV